MARLALLVGLCLGLAAIAHFRAAPANPPPTDTATPPPPPTEAPLPQVKTQAGPLALEAKYASRYAQTGADDTYLTLDVSAVSNHEEKPAPVSVVVVIDRSGSMQGEKLAGALVAANALLDRLGPDDQLAIVDYSSEARAHAPTRCDEPGKAALRAYLARLDADGGTNIYGALELAGRLAAESGPGFHAHRIVLLSDGEPNQGEVSFDGLTGLAERLHEHTATVSAIGLGYDYNEVLMHGLAERGGGAYGYLPNLEHLAQVLDLELAQARGLSASKVAVDLVPQPGTRIVEVFGWPTTPTALGVRVLLPDLAERSHQRIVAKLHVDGKADGVPHQPVSVSASATMPGSTSELRTESASPGVYLAASHDKVLQGRDPSSWDLAAHAEASRLLAQAATASRDGRSEDAARVLDGARSFFRGFGESANALSGDLRMLQASRAQVLSGDAEVRSAASKDLHRKYLQNFGNSATY